MSLMPGADGDATATRAFTPMSGVGFLVCFIRTPVFR